jgi:NADH-quinone oxidoreductase subunit L
MTLPLVILAFFSVTFGWTGIPEKFPAIGGIVPNWFHEFVGGTLLEHPEALAFSWVPLITSLAVSLGGLTLGWLVYRNTRAGAKDPVEGALGATIYRWLKNKYYVDELYQVVFIRPAGWIAETFTSKWMDRGVIDGFLHWLARASIAIGAFFRNVIDKPIINGPPDRLSEWVRDQIAPAMRYIQTGRIQQYMVLALLSLAVFSALFFFLLQR